MIVADTNVLSELMKPTPDARVERWAEPFRRVELFTTAVSEAEIRYGIERLPLGRRRRAYEAAANDVFRSFDDKIVPFGRTAAVLYAQIVAARARAGAPMSAFDGQIAAICAEHGATLATHNVRDFADTGVALVNPWGFAPA